MANWIVSIIYAEQLKMHSMIFDREFWKEGYVLNNERVLKVTWNTESNDNSNNRESIVVKIVDVKHGNQLEGRMLKKVEYHLDLVICTIIIILSHQ